jgi:hypothetical protein
MRTRGLALAGAIAAVTVALPTSGALAQTSQFDDQTEAANSSSDVTSVEVTNNRVQDMFRVKVRIDRIRVGSTLVVYVDRRMKNAGPELRMVAAPDSEWSLFRVGGWGQRGKLVDTCGRVRMSSFERDHLAKWTATRSCLNLHGAVRVSVKSVDPDGDVDWAPKRHEFFPKVSAR